MTAGVNYSDDFIRRQWIGRTTALISMLGSCAIIFDICKTMFQKSNINRPHQRALNESTSTQIILLMSIMDLVYSFFSFFLASIMAPKDTAYLSFGNDASCTAQGFIISLFAFTGIIYNAVLALHFLFVVRFGWKERHFTTNCSRFWFFLAPLLCSLALSVWTLLEGAFNPSFGQCYVEKAPYLCETPLFPDVECTQGKRANEINMVGSIIILICYFMISASMIVLCWSVFQTEKASKRHIFKTESNVPTQPQNTERTKAERNKKKKSHVIAQIGILYSWCFIIAFLPFIVINLGYQVRNKSAPSWLFDGMFALAPLQGFFNALVYSYRKNPKKRWNRKYRSGFSSKLGDAKDSKTPGTSYNVGTGEEFKISSNVENEASSTKKGEKSFQISLE